MSEYLFELLLEEMPPADIEMILNTLETNLKDALEKARIDHGKIDVFSTPRRFGFLIHDIALTQHDATWIKKGPSENVAFKDRKPTKALEGFLKSNNAQISDIEISESEGGNTFNHFKFISIYPSDEMGKWRILIHTSGSLDDFNHRRRDRSI
jgi:glycyl-tRNA synthetase beta chain